MTFSALPTEVKSLIADFLLPSGFSKEEVRACAQNLASLSRVSQNLRDICVPKLATLERLYQERYGVSFEAMGRIRKYRYRAHLNPALRKELWRGEKSNIFLLGPMIRKLEKWVERTYLIPWIQEEFGPELGPQLLGALESGPPRCSHPWGKHGYDAKVEADIKTMVKLDPQILGYRGDNGKTPLQVACLNPSIPIHMVEYLLEMGADPHSTIEIRIDPIFGSAACWQRVNIEEFLSLRIGVHTQYGVFDAERFEGIKDLLIKYGVVRRHPLANRLGI